jgi:hypothetical protein
MVSMGKSNVVCSAKLTFGDGDKLTHDTTAPILTV